MKNYSIKPLVTWLAPYSHTAPVPPQELQALKEKLQRCAKKHRALTRQRYEVYCEIISAVQKNFLSPLYKAELEQLITETLIAQKHTFYGQKTLSGNKNTFDPVPEALDDGGNEFHDLAFYYPRRLKHISKHHQLVDLPELSPALTKLPLETTAQPERGHIEQEYQMRKYLSALQENINVINKDGSKHAIFYFRCEENSARVLLGNLQTEYKSRTAPLALPHARVALHHRTLTRTLLQEALHYAATRQKPKILIQAGSAMQIAQGAANNDEPEDILRLVTKENLPTFEEKYKIFRERYDKVPLGHIFKKGDCVVYDKTQIKMEVCPARAANLIPIIYQITADQDAFRKEITDEIVQQDLLKNIPLDLGQKYFAPNDGAGIDGWPRHRANFSREYNERTIYENDYISDLREVIGLDYSELTNLPAGLAQRRALAHLAFYSDVRHAFGANKPEALLTALDKIFSYVVAPPGQTLSTEKVGRLAEIIAHEKLAPTELPIYALLEPFLREYKYHEPVLEKFKTIKVIASPDGGAPLYLVKNKLADIVYNRPPPQCGDIRAEDDYHVFRCANGIAHLHYWYDYIVPEILREMGIDYRRVYIYTSHTKDGSSYTPPAPRTPENYPKEDLQIASAWEILTPASDLVRRPVVLF